MEKMKEKKSAFNNIYLIPPDSNVELKTGARLVQV